MRFGFRWLLHTVFFFSFCLAAAVWPRLNYQKYHCQLQCFANLTAKANCVAPRSIVAWGRGQLELHFQSRTAAMHLAA